MEQHIPLTNHNLLTPTVEIVLKEGHCCLMRKGGEKEKILHTCSLLQKFTAKRKFNTITGN